MLSEKIFYYTNKIKSISADIEKENSKILEYQTLLIQEESKYNEKSFFNRLFNKNHQNFYKMEAPCFSYGEEIL